MKVRVTTTVMLLLMGNLLVAQGSMNMTLEFNWDDNSLPTSGGLAWNDCWGYTAPDGTEVAIVGSLQRVYFFDVTNPSLPTVIDYFPVQNMNGTTNSSIWRDFKTYDHYCYASADQGNSGLLIFDLQYVPDSVVLVDQDFSFFARSHNIWIDTDNARLYTAGANTNSAGTIIFDLSANPEAPVEIGSPTFPLGYIHDIHVVENIAYASHGSDQALSIYDMEDPEDPILIKTFDSYPEPGYNHSAWLNASGNKLVFADETHGQSLKLIDPNIDEPQTTNYHLFKSQLLEGNTNSIAHNPFILGNLCIVAYYHDGVQVFNIADTNNITRVAYYDTYENTDYSGYDGVWGVYPYLASGNIIASDTENGLFVLSLTEGILPLDFIGLTLHPDGKHVRIEWQVTGVQDDEVFTVEHSTDGSHFAPVTSVPSERQVHRYNALHDDPGPGVHFYRIAMKQRDGQVKMSPVKSVQLTTGTPFYVQTTLIGDLLTADLQAAGNLTLISVDGKVLFTRQVQDAGRIEIPTGHLPAGQYYLVYRNGKSEEVSAVLKK